MSESFDDTRRRAQRSAVRLVGDLGPPPSVEASLGDCRICRCPCLPSMGVVRRPGWLAHLNCVLASGGKA
jgi:hypothetical protein